MSKKNGKTLFVTVGSTKFENLIDRVLDEDILEILNKNGFKKLILQIGNGKHANEQLQEAMRNNSEQFITKFNQTVYPYTYKGAIANDLKQADLVISHAGAGSIIESLEENKLVVVVVNENLMNNHQYELAEKMQNENYLVYSLCSNLSEKLNFLFSNLNSIKTYEKGRPDVFAKHLDSICFA